ncbi:DUF1842 domain-containing protein [Paludibacter sp.]|uniref:DUF1842 domain-containing protein n=1 Tax=Paludibacter sp. TaxID=1898105 RepID=UPI0013557AA1|nr:DUF1842 domain-containing protein [Paludibacter sp.]MTK52283.1 DUF1842 domain-containing protein [Paludibacter sp.]
MGKDVGMFMITYLIGDNTPGSFTLNASLIVSTPNQAISGIGKLLQPTSSPQDIHSNLQGHYAVMCIMPQNCHIQIILTGYPIQAWSGYGGIGPANNPNIKILLALTEDWQSGSATFAFMNSSGNWEEIKGVPVKKISGLTPSDL